MEVVIVPKREFSITLPIDDIIEDINTMPLIERFAVISKLLNEIQLVNKHELTEEQKMIVLDFLKRTYELFSDTLL